jgi:nitroimidazol reductase NimA-like FMN-containing flavoprotein (pyridoxamine 5'-phosphate oxidase superfamily)
MKKWTRAEQEFVETARVARLATVAPSGMPHVVPVCPLFENGRLFVATDRDTSKVRHVLAHPQVVLVFDDYTEDWNHLRGVLVEGEARAAGAPLFRRVRAGLYRKFQQYERIAPLGDGNAMALEIVPRCKVSWGF